MTALGLRIRHLTFIGPVRPPATMEFGPGLNVIYGASDTGKSFIVDSIDYMLGGKGPLRHFKERDGYDRILLAMETLSGEQFTLQRSVDGGGFLLFDGLHFEKAPDGQGTPLMDIHNEKRADNLSMFLLEKIGLAGKRIRKNARMETQSLSFRNLARLIIVNEEEIIQKRSPLSDGNYTADTANTSAFKLMITGLDDSALTATRSASAEENSREGQLELLDQLITDMKRQVKELAGAPSELEAQLEKLDASIAERGQQLASSEAQYREASAKRRDLLTRLDEGNNRLTEITNLLDRFTLLDDHYISDLERLKGIEEAGSLFSALTEAACPLCGALAEHHRLKDECDGNVEAVVAAAHAEAVKIQLRQSELQDTIANLEREQKSFERRLPKVEAYYHAAARQIETLLAPALRQLRTGYGQLADKKGEVREALGFHKTLKDLEDRKIKLLAEDSANGGTSAADIGLPSTAVDAFATEVLSILKAWHFPNADRVHFDPKAKDLVINGKDRISYGKGMRAITQAAFSIGLMEFCHKNGMPHPGFLILDSPLLSYRKPDNQEDDLRGTDLNSQFYAYLQGLNADGQVIIVENSDPPAAVQLLPQVTKFIGKEGEQRFGYFEKATPTPLLP
ncbi:MAG: AAA family ATPase [Pirellulaceae bacterium]|nr:AAA family ATPase [Pirellulaceae bacterium]